MEPLAGVLTPQPLLPDKPPWVVEQVAAHGGELPEIHTGFVGLESHNLCGESRDEERDSEIEEIQMESAPTVEKGTTISPRERRYTRSSIRKGGVARPHGAGRVRRDKKKVRFSPLLSDLRVKEFMLETAAKLKEKPLATEEHRFILPRVVDSGQHQPVGAMEVDPNSVGIQLGNRFTSLEENEEGDKGSQGSGNSGQVVGSVVEQGGPSLRVPECLLSKEVDMDVGRILPASVTTPVSRAAPANNNLSDYKKNRILGYINHTKGVRTLIANAWDTDEWNFFNDQCIYMGYEPDYLVVDTEDYMEDNLMNIKGSPHLPENKKQAIFKALNSNAKAVKAKHMTAWSVGEWSFFKNQVDSFGIDMNYAVEDVEHVDNGMAAFIADQF
ncbi:hypothetical protein R6Q59_014824 [Mikania micrantha]